MQKAMYDADVAVLLPRARETYCDSDSILLTMAVSVVSLGSTERQTLIVAYGSPMSICDISRTRSARWTEPDWAVLVQFVPSK